MIFDAIFVVQRKNQLIMCYLNVPRFADLGFVKISFFSWVSSVFTNMDYLFWRLLEEYDFSNFPWILWYIWKNRNNKVFNNKDENPHEILRIAEVDGDVWA